MTKIIRSIEEDDGVSGQLIRSEVQSRFEQSFTSSTSVTVAHNLGHESHLTVIDSAGVVLIPDTITHDSVNQVTFTFSTAKTGTAICSL